MSRYELAARKQNRQVFVGWDPPLASYFLQVYDTQADPDSQPFVWLGAAERLDFVQLSRALEPYATLPLDIAVKLCRDRESE